MTFDQFYETFVVLLNTFLLNQGLRVAAKIGRLPAKDDREAASHGFAILTVLILCGIFLLFIIFHFRPMLRAWLT